MDLDRVITLLRRRLPLVLLGAVIGAVLSFAVSSVLPRSYTATATVLVFQTSAVGNVQLGDVMTSERLATTYVDLLRRRPVLTATITALHLDMTPDDLAQQVKVDLVRDTQLLQVHVSDRDPARAAAIANTLVDVFVRQVAALQKQSFTDAETHLDQDIAANEARRQDTQQQLDTLKALSTPTSAQQAEIVRLTGLLGQFDATRDNLQRSAAAVRQTEATTGTQLQMAERADVPRAPVFPRTALNVGLAAVFGLLLGAALAWLLEYLDNTLKTPEAVQGMLALPTLAQVRANGRPPARRRGKGGGPGAGPAALVARDAGRAEAAESYRLLRTNIEFIDVDHPSHRLLVTSAVPGEGKSTVAANLAVVLAQSGKRVLLIDADLRRPSVGRIFGLPNSRGLTTLLLADGAPGRPQVPPDAAILAAPGVANLALLLSGPLPPNPGDLLGSQRMAALLETLTAGYDLLVIDSPPVLAATDPLVLARQSDGVLLVIDAADTRAPLVRQAAESIRQVGARLLGVVLNKLPATGARPYYAYYQSDEPAATPDVHPALGPAAAVEGARPTPGTTYSQDPTMRG